MKRRLTFSLLLLLTASLAWSQNVIYVHGGATGNNDGSSWTDAYTSLAVACSTANANDSIFVAEGIYMPDTTQIIANPSIRIFGGFPDTGNPVWADRDWEAHPTIVTGDKNGDDNGTFAMRADNAIRIFVSKDFIELNGLIIEHGGNNTGGTGCGLAFGGANTREAKVVDCIFRENWSTLNGNLNGQGGAIRGAAVNENDTIYIENVTFDHNMAFEGGALLVQGTPIIKNCRFLRNEAERGSAIIEFQAGNGNVPGENYGYFVGCLFYKNKSYNNGAASTFGYNGDPRSDQFFVNCIFKDNSSEPPSGQQSGNVMRYGGTVDFYFYNSIFDEPNSDRPFALSLGGSYNFHNCILNMDIYTGIPQIDSFFTVDTTKTFNQNLNMNYETVDSVNGIILPGCNSIALNYGDSTWLDSLPAIARPDLDADGNDRISGDNIEAGPFENPCIVSTVQPQIELPKMVLYPNPAQDWIRVKLDTPSALQLYDLEGKRMAEYAKGTEEINVSGLKSGIYFLRTLDGRLTEKFIKR